MFTQAGRDRYVQSYRTFSKQLRRVTWLHAKSETAKVRIAPDFDVRVGCVAAFSKDVNHQLPSSPRQEPTCSFWTVHSCDRKAGVSPSLPNIPCVTSNLAGVILTAKDCFSMLEEQIVGHSRSCKLNSHSCWHFTRDSAAYMPYYSPELSNYLCCKMVGSGACI